MRNSDSVGWRRASAVKVRSGEVIEVLFLTARENGGKGSKVWKMVLGEGPSAQDALPHLY
jgi:hypothetical protein